MPKFFKNSIYALVVFQLLILIVYKVFLKGFKHFDKPMFNQFELLFNDTIKQDYLFCVLFAFYLLAVILELLIRYLI